MIKKRFISMLVLLMVAVTGAWADADVTWNSSNVSDLRVWGPYDWDSYTKEGITLKGNAENVDAEWANYGDGDGINFNMNASGGYTFTAPKGKKFTKIEMTIYSYDGWFQAAYNDQLGSGWPSGEDAAYTVYSTNKVTWTGDATSTVDLLTDAGLSSFGGATVSSIDFYFEAPAEPEPAGDETVVTITNADLPTETTTSMSKDGVTITAYDAITNTMIRSQFGPGSFTNTIGNFTKIEVVVVAGDGTMNEMYGQGWTGDASKRTWTGNAESVEFAGIIQGADITITCTIEPAAAPAASTYTVTLKEGTEDADKWTITPAEATTTGVAAGTEVKATYGGTKKVKSVKAVKKVAAGPTYNETKSINDGPVSVAAGEHWLITGTGTQTTNTMSIGAGATVTLDGVNISSDGYCIKCAGDATIILKDGSTNTLTGTGYQVYPALSAGDAGTTLTIQGSTGVLNVESVDYCAGIGGGLSNTNNTCGNIRIEGGVITVQGGYGGAGIGTDAGQATCGDIIITGGTITANGGGRAAGIGGGTSDYGNTVCGNITIANTVTKVTATAGNQAPYSIGKGYGGSASCGTVTIGGVVGAITDSPFTYPVPAVPTLADVFTDGAVVGVAVKNTYDTYTVTGTYSGGSYTSYTKSSNDIEEVTMTKDGNNLVVWIKSDMNSECTLTFNTQDNTYTKSFKAGTGAAVWDLSEFVSITVNGTDITSSLEDVTPAAPAETTVTWTTAEMDEYFMVEGDFEYNNSHNGITVTASGSGPGSGGWTGNNIDVHGPMTFTFTSTVGNIKSIVITAENIRIDEWSAPSGWTANEHGEEPRTLSWNGTASASVNLTLSEGQNFSNISTIVFTLE